MTRKRWMVVAAAALAAVVVVAVALVVVRQLDDDETRLSRAVSMAPGDAQRLLWTDWSGVRDELGLDLDATSSADEVQQLLDRGYDADLTSTSALTTSAVTMQESLGFSPATVQWELYTQSAGSASLIMKLGEGVSTDDVAEALRAVEYAEPDEPGGTWTRDAETSPVSTELTPTLGFIVLDEDAGMVLASDRSAGTDAASSSVAKAASEPVPAGVVEALGTPLTAAIYSGAEACGALAMANADAGDQAAGEALVADAGRVNPLTGFGIGADDGGDVRVTLGFEDDEQARTNADTRAVLASGPAPGQGGAFSDRFTVEKVGAEKSVVTLDLDPLEGESLVSDLSNGPVLFATC